MNWPLLPSQGFLASWPADPQAARRKGSALKRLRILQEDFREQILERIVCTHMDPTVQTRISRFASVALNPARDITQAVAMSYDLGVRRVLKGAPEEAQLAFAALVKETEAATLAPNWNRYAFLLGPTIVVPCVRRGRIALELLRPDSLDVLPDPEDPLGTPAAAVWAAHGGDAAFVALDGDAWHYLNEQGREIRTSRHGLGFFPGAVFRLDHPTDGWWPRTYQERLVDATITIASTYAVMQWVRKSQNKKLLLVVGETENIPRGQLLDPELALTIESRQQNATTISVEDFTTSPEYFLAEIRFTLENVIGSVGIPQSAVTYDVDKDGGFMAANFKKERLGHLREAQIPFMDRGEHALWPATVAMAQAAGHPLGGKLPPPDEIRDMLAVEWPRLKTIDDPLQREQLYREQLKRGGVSPIDMLQEDRPGLTRAECEALMRSNLGDYAALATELAERNLVLDLASGIITSAASFGKLGPAVRDGTSPSAPAKPGSSP